MCKVGDTTGVNNGSTAQIMVSSVPLSLCFFFLLMVCPLVSFGGKSHFHSTCATTEAGDFIPPQGNVTCRGWWVRNKKENHAQVYAKGTINLLERLKKNTEYNKLQQKIKSVYRRRWWSTLLSSTKSTDLTANKHELPVSVLPEWSAPAAPMQTINSKVWISSSSLTS